LFRDSYRNEIVDIEANSVMMLIVGFSNLTVLYMKMVSASTIDETFSSSWFFWRITNAAAFVIQARSKSESFNGDPYK